MGDNVEERRRFSESSFRQDALARLKKDIGDLKEDRPNLEQQVAKYMDRMRKIVDGTEQEMRESVSKMSKFPAHVWKIETVRTKADETGEKANDAAYNAVDKLAKVAERNFDRANKLVYGNILGFRGKDSSKSVELISYIKEAVCDKVKGNYLRGVVIKQKGIT